METEIIYIEPELNPEIEKEISEKLSKIIDEYMDAALLGMECPMCGDHMYYKQKCWTCKFKYEVIPTAIE
jgi:uncharacterized OB-fold protein